MIFLDSIQNCRREFNSTAFQQFQAKRGDFSSFLQKPRTFRPGFFILTAHLTAYPFHKRAENATNSGACPVFSYKLPVSPPFCPSTADVMRRPADRPDGASDGVKALGPLRGCFLALICP